MIYSLLEKVLIFSFCLFSATIIGQSHQIEDEYHRKAKAFISLGKLDSAKIYISKMKQSKNLCRCWTGHSYEAGVYYKLGEHKKSDSILQELILITDPHKRQNNFKYSDLMVGKSFSDCVKIVNINIYRRLFYIYKRYSAFDSAFFYLNKRKDIIKSLSEKNTYYYRNLTAIDKNLANLFMELKQFQNAKEILIVANRDMRDLSISTNDEWYLAFQKEKVYLLSSLANSYFHIFNEEGKKEYIDSSFQYQKNAFYLEKKIDGIVLNNVKRHNYSKLSRFSYYKEDFKAFKQYLDSLSMLKSQEKNSGELSLFAKYFNQINNLDSAIYYEKKYLKTLTSRSIFKIDQVSTLQRISELYYKKKNLDSAHKFSQRTLNLADELKENEINGITSIKQKELNDIKEFNKEIVFEKNQNQNMFFIILGSLVTLLILVSFLYFKNKKKQVEKFRILDKKYQSIKNVKPSENLINKTRANQIEYELQKIEDSTLFLNSDFSLLFVSKALKINRTYISKTINESKGVSFKKYLAKLRIDHLIELLESEPKYRKYSINALGEEIGYTNASSFTRIFKNEVGCSPSEYLKRYN